MKKAFPLITVALLALLLSPSCGKKSSHTPTCQIITVTDQTTTTTTFNINYDNSGRVSTEQVVSGSTVTNKVFTYIGNTEIMTSASSTNYSTDSITLNSDGLIVSDYYKDNFPADAMSTINTYSGTELQKQIVTMGNNAPQTATYTWSNGDMVASSGSPSITYSYNSKASEEGDYWQIIQLINYGASFIKTAHQLAGYAYTNNIENINYTYDNTGKVTGVTGTAGASVENISYQYQCN